MGVGGGGAPRAAQQLHAEQREGTTPRLSRGFATFVLGGGRGVKPMGAAVIATACRSPLKRVATAGAAPGAASGAADSLE